MEIHQDCRYFKGNLPCTFHKRQGIHCEDCPYYEKIAFKILIIKLDAVGDVLRTTCILQGLMEKYQDAHITWLTRKNAIELFKNNVSQGTGTVNTSQFNGTAPFTIGNFVGLFYDGLIDEVGVWNRALSGSEVAELYNGGSGDPYPF